MLTGIASGTHGPGARNTAMIHVTPLTAFSSPLVPDVSMMSRGSGPIISRSKCPFFAYIEWAFGPTVPFRPTRLVIVIGGSAASPDSMSSIFCGHPGQVNFLHVEPLNTPF